MIGETVSHYRILEKLGEGGMGVVYKAEDTRLGRTVALKFLPVSLTTDPDAKERFVREARAASALDHPNICTIHEIDETDDGQMFICMSCYEGEVLKSRIARGQLPLDEAVDIADHIARGLAKAHSRGIVHRDVKPANVLVTEDGEVKLLDFGLAKLADQTGTTKIGTKIGTARYVSPEQARGQEVDHRTDIWSLGVVLYEMLAGVPPFQSTNEQALIYAVVNEEPRPVGDLRHETPPELTQVVQRAMSKDPSFRHEDAESFLADLRSAAESLGAPAEGTRRVVHSLPSIAVLPFVDMSPEGDQEYFCDGMAEELINGLTGIERLQVASRTSAFQFKGTGHDVRAIGRELKVGTVLEGSVRKAGNRLRITAQLINVADGYHLWSEKFDRDADDVFAIQDEISLAIVEKLRVKLLGDEKTRLVKRHTDDQEAYSLYLRGRYYWNRRYEGGLRKATAYFQQAIERDPGYALPYVGTADALHIMGYYGFLSPAEAFPQAKAAAMKALEIDDSLGEAHAALGWIGTFYDWDWDAAERRYARALELSPRYATAHEWYALHLTAVGRFDEAIAEVRRAQALEPVSLIVNAAVGAILYLTRHHEEATEQLVRTLDMDPSFILPRVWAGDNYTCLGMYEDAIAHLRIAVDAAPDMTYALGSLGCAYALAGQRDEARAVLGRFDELARVRYVSSVHRALPHIGLGEGDRAIESFANGLAERDPLAPWIRVAPVLDPLRGRPGFEALAERMGFPE
jgi:serine/threonine protein kinase/tetratricopeptide (TPR) repeat protein